MTTPPDFTRGTINLASADLGARALSSTNDFFGAVGRMLQDKPAEFIPGLYDDAGKYMDGWESTRRRKGGHDHAVVELAVPGSIVGFDVDTSFFTGNYAPACRIEAARLDGAPDDGTEWTEILPAQPLGASAHHYFDCADAGVWTHLRLHIYPDGGVARLRVYGHPRPDLAVGDEHDLASALTGGRVVAASDDHFGGSARLLLPSAPKNMGDAWDTHRRREPGHEWIILALGRRGTLSRFEVDTAFHRGNFPPAFSIQAADLDAGTAALAKSVMSSAMFWDVLLPETPLEADRLHQVVCPDPRPVTHLRVNIHPDGGLARLRAFGRLLA